MCSGIPASLWKRGTGIDEFCGSRLISLSGTVLFPGISGLNARELRAVLLEQVGFQKRFLKYPQHSVYHAGTWVAPELLPDSGS